MWHLKPHVVAADFAAPAGHFGPDDCPAAPPRTHQQLKSLKCLCYWMKRT